MKLKLCNISAYDSTFIAQSEDLCGTSNCVFSDWSIGTYFRIDENGNPQAHFEIRDKLFGKNILFKTDNYQELSKWIDEHFEEIQKQINVNKEEWMKNHKKLFKCEVSPC
jgi:hypothetical protein